eukprot:CAMPEP_0118664196 /NCGR_PEP_ID=MMETSP0785-20121206/17862_1 /TAXON_ID=91992 /ORGANISM="Bolidomonas pacifica, Strain CCMP 1866" /LENGTH=242 /DNA_ID=CAMNT_0006558043 /DNA_START=28 /DNA_END=753 /DNA_ORIENTATION=-
MKHVKILRERAEAVRKMIIEATQCTASIGVGRNKLLAKMATDKIKPSERNGWKGGDGGIGICKDYRTSMRDMDLRDIPGVGRKTEEKLKKSEHKLAKVTEVWRLGKDAKRILQQIVGAGLGQTIYDCCHGKDDRKVQAQRRKSIGAECNYGIRFNGPYGPDYLVKGLVEEVVRRCKDNGVAGGEQVTLKLKHRHPDAENKTYKFNGHGWCTNHSSSAKVLVRDSKDVEKLNSVCWQLYRDLR